MNCIHCKNGLIAKPIYKPAGPHIKQICSLCKVFIKFVKKTDVV